MDEAVETVETEEMDDAREERELSDIIDSGLEPCEVELTTDGRRESVRYFSTSMVVLGNVSMAQRLMACLCAVLIAEHMDGRRELHALAAGVNVATDVGVSCGVGRGPMRASAGVGGAMLAPGSIRGSAVGVGVLSCEVESTCIASSGLLLGVVFAKGEAKP